jgi:hypothetical protein
LGPTIPTRPPGTMRLVGSTNDLKPESFILHRRMR